LRDALVATARKDERNPLTVTADVVGRRADPRARNEAHHPAAGPRALLTPWLTSPWCPHRSINHAIGINAQTMSGASRAERGSTAT
jgi:hypothetical protein